MEYQKGPDLPGGSCCKSPEKKILSLYLSEKEKCGLIVNIGLKNMALEIPVIFSGKFWITL
jgi:hypothetical protein